MQTAVGECVTVLRVNVDGAECAAELGPLAATTTVTSTATTTATATTSPSPASPAGAAAPPPVTGSPPLTPPTAGCSITLSESLVPWGVEAVPRPGTAVRGGVAFQCGKMYFADIVVDPQDAAAAVEFRVRGHGSSSVHLRASKGSQPMQHLGADYKGVDQSNYVYTLRIARDSTPPLTTGRYFIGVFGMQLLPRPFSNFELSVGVRGGVTLAPDDRDMFFAMPDTQ
jgi:hypothetical protein